MLKIMYQLLKPVAYNKTKTKNKKIIKKKTNNKTSPNRTKKTQQSPTKTITKTQTNNAMKPRCQRTATGDWCDFFLFAVHSYRYGKVGTNKRCVPSASCFMLEFHAKCDILVRHFGLKFRTYIQFKP